MMSINNFLKTNTFSSVLDFNINKINKSIISFSKDSIFTKNYVHKAYSFNKKN